MADSPGVRISIVDAGSWPSNSADDGWPSAAAADPAGAPGRAAGRSARAGKRTFGAAAVDGGDAVDGGGGARRARRRALLALLAAVLCAGGLVQGVRALTPGPIAGSGRFDDSALLGVCPPTRACLAIPGASAAMQAAARSWFPGLPVVGASELVDARTGEAYTQRMVLSGPGFDLVLSASRAPDAAPVPMQSQVSSIQGRVVVSGWPANGTAQRGASAVMIAEGGASLPLPGALAWATTVDLFG
jgi:hypothetical protein